MVALADPKDATPPKMVTVVEPVTGRLADVIEDSDKMSNVNAEDREDTRDVIVAARECLIKLDPWPERTFKVLSETQLEDSEAVLCNREDGER